jgi:hypothetical protein
MRTKALAISVWCLAFVGCYGRVASPVANSEIERLIESLASANPPPEFPNNPFNVRLSPDYDFEKQRVVSNACTKLEDLGAIAFPYLLQHLDDSRFSCTRSGAVYFNLTVAETCSGLIKNQVDFVCGPRLPMSKSDACDFFKFRWNDDLIAWWNQNHDRTLLEMQIDCLQFKISRAKELGLNFGELTEKLDQIRSAGKSWQQLETERNQREGSESFTVFDEVLLEHDKWENPTR